MIKIALIIGCIILAPTGNLLLKWGMSECGNVAQTHLSILQYAGQVFSKPQILVGAVVYLISALMWMALLSMMELSAVYPIFVSAAFLIVMIASAIFFSEHVTPLRILGTLVVILGIFIVAQSTRWG